MFFILGEANFLRGLTNFFSELLDCNKLLIFIESLIIIHWKSAKKSKVIVVFGQNLGQIRFNVVKKKQRNWHFNEVFFIIYMRYIGLYIQKQEVVVVEITESKLKAKLAINSIFEGN